MIDNNQNTDGWVRPLGKFESFLEDYHQKGFMISSYSLTLNSKSPLEENDLEKAFIHLQRKIPSLSVCIRPKNENELWFHKRETENFDLQVLENVEDVQKEFEDLARHHYNSFDGPLFCARLIPQALDASCAMPEIKQQYPHQYILLIGFHHSITDGTSNIKICNAFFNLLNSVIAGEFINDLEKIGKHVSSEKTEELIYPYMLEFMRNPEELESYHKMNLEGFDDLLFLKAFPPPANETSQTRSISYSLSKEETLCFLKRCKLEGVTIHAGFCSVINAALVEIIKGAGFEREIFVIKSYHTINARRYMEEDSSEILGAHLIICNIAANVNGHSNDDDFWEQAKMFNSDFTSKLMNKVPLKDAASLYLLPEPEQNSQKSAEVTFAKPFYFGTTNMGNITSIFPGEGDHVQVTDFKRTTSTVDNLCSHIMQTFRGRFIYSMDYENKLMTKETAQLYVNTIFKVLRKVTNIPEIKN